MPADWALRELEVVPYVMIVEDWHPPDAVAKVVAWESFHRLCLIRDVQSEFDGAKNLSRHKSGVSVTWDDDMLASEVRFDRR